MGKALLCDRCGVCFNPLTIKDEFMSFTNPMIRTSSDVKDFLRGRYLDPKAGADAEIDLCPTCTKRLLMFMEDGKK